MHYWFTEDFSSVLFVFTIIYFGAEILLEVPTKIASTIDNAMKKAKMSQKHNTSLGLELSALIRIGLV
jgi:hypothetical protein